MIHVGQYAFAGRLMPDMTTPRREQSPGFEVQEDRHKTGKHLG